jgi:hypothetical protein
MSDYETILEILSRSSEMKDHYSFCDCDVTGNQYKYITLREYADEVDLTFDKDGNIL